MTKPGNSDILLEQWASKMTQGIKALATQSGQSECEPWDPCVRWKKTSDSTDLPSDPWAHAMAHVTTHTPTMIVSKPENKKLGEMDKLLRRQHLHRTVPEQS